MVGLLYIGLIGLLGALVGIPSVTLYLMFETCARRVGEAKARHSRTDTPSWSSSDVAPSSAG